MVWEERDEERRTISLYQYAKITDPKAFRDKLFLEWTDLGVFGRTYVAHEGINAQVSIPEARFEDFRKQLYSIDFLNGIRLNNAIEDDGKSFYVLKIKVVIVSLVLVFTTMQLLM